ncbi:transcriptional antiterminator NusG [Arcanobacterium wilhelmae]|uniref:Transcription termination/antitermination protein NusG n=1 Tax=Arcanobacterium wilhelmae TaxID=1803177 RepID=A0ABT9NCC3_9ACTO|nr:transcription termination/antitermination protein NusG [Arcanobacterium wilhelmae]MDP9801371.1 transcriptional antiterminator NusG [Arcanobacterium wilhelmae]WFN90706.1 transcription termination/antitermination protein NusG [Arcanobacterium wilhelmae]
MSEENVNPLFSDAQEAPEVQAEVAQEEATEAPVEPVEESTPAAPAKEEAPEGVVTEEMVRDQIKGLPGRWYVLHTYAGYEKRVKQSLETRMHSMNMEDYIFQIEVPMEEVYEVKKGQQKLVSRVRMPGYAVVRMELTDDSWRVVQSTNGVTGFVGNGRDPVALSLDEAVQLLTPVVEQQVAAEAVAAGKPVLSGTPEFEVEYEVGEVVTLTTEPWVGMPATISEVDPVNQRLTVLMTLVGQETPVDLSFGQIKKMD